MTTTIKNVATGNPTQITVYANGDGSAIHDVAPSVFGYVESAVSIALDIAAVVSGQAYLYFAAAAMDAAEAGQDFSNGQDIQGILNLAQAVSAGILGGTGGTTPLGTTSTTPLTTAQVAARVINVAAQGVGGVYGVVRSAQNGNAAGILAGALEAAAGATGMGMVSGDQMQATLDALASGLGTAGLATSVAGDFASGNLAQGLVDSLNLYLPAVAQAYANDQANQANLQMNAAACAAGGTNPAPNVDIPNFSGIAAASTNAPTAATSESGATVTPVTAGGLTNVDNIIGSGTGAVVTQSGQTYVVAATPTSLGDTIQATLSGLANDVMSFLAYLDPISPAEAAIPGSAPATSAASGPGVVNYSNSDGSQDIKTGGSAAWRDNNPGNMIAGAGAYQPIGTNTNPQGRPVIFPDFQTGWNALIANLQSSNYTNLFLYDAINRWVGNGVPGSDPPTYVKNVVSWTGLNPSAVLNTLTPNQLNAVGSAIMRREGYIPGTVTHTGP